MNLFLPFLFLPALLTPSVIFVKLNHPPPSTFTTRNSFTAAVTYFMCVLVSDGCRNHTTQQKCQLLPENRAPRPPSSLRPHSRSYHLSSPSSSTLSYKQKPQSRTKNNSGKDNALTISAKKSASLLILGPTRVIMVYLSCLASAKSRARAVVIMGILQNLPETYRLLNLTQRF